MRALPPKIDLAKHVGYIASMEGMASHSMLPCPGGCNFPVTIAEGLILEPAKMPHVYPDLRLTPLVKLDKSVRGFTSKFAFFFGSNLWLSSRACRRWPAISCRQPMYVDESSMSRYREVRARASLKYADVSLNLVHGLILCLISSSGSSAVRLGTLRMPLNMESRAAIGVACCLDFSFR